MNKVDFAYWNAQTGNLKVMGSAESPNALGEVLLQNFPDIKSTLETGMLFFRVNNTKLIPYHGNHLQLSNFIEILFNEAGFFDTQLPPQPPQP